MVRFFVVTLIVAVLPLLPTIFVDVKNNHVSFNKAWGQLVNPGEESKGRVIFIGICILLLAANFVMRGWFDFLHNMLNFSIWCIVFVAAAKIVLTTKRLANGVPFTEAVISTICSWTPLTIFAFILNILSAVLYNFFNGIIDFHGICGSSLVSYAQHIGWCLSSPQP
jgi:hypothetical protein